MKKIIALAVLFSFAVLPFGGCSSDKFIEIRTDKKVGSGFDSETYVWETWLYSTNRVDFEMK